MKRGEKREEEIANYQAIIDNVALLFGKWEHEMIGKFNAMVLLAVVVSIGLGISSYWMLRAGSF